MDRFLEEALKEDIGRGDLFEKCCKKSQRVEAKIVAKSEGVLAGVLYVKRLCEMQNIDIELFLDDGEPLCSGETIAHIRGEYTTLLKTERLLLNIIQHASGIATNTHRVVSKIAGYNLKILDTRKTRPLLRSFEKYAARIGGATNHRFGLDDALMLKDTHLKHIENLSEFVKSARNSIPFTAKIEIECEDVMMVRSAFEAGADIVMCDNMDLESIKESVALRNREYKNILIEVSGNITEENIEHYAECGVDAISSGSLIHQAQWLDISMKML